MKEGGGSGDQSGAVLKKKSSSGCLIIKKKSGGNGMGMGGFSGGTSSSRQNFDSGKEKKRSRMILSDSESSQEFVEPVRRKVMAGTRSDKFGNGSAMGSRDIERDRMRNGLDVFEFDEYERFDEKNRANFYDDRLQLYRRSGDRRESGGGSSGVLVDKRKHSYRDSTSNVPSSKSKIKYDNKNKYESEDDEAHLPISVLREKYREASDEPIRVQGKNGVLKVMVNKKKKLELPHSDFDHVDVKGKKDSRSEDVLKKKKLSVHEKSYDHREAEERKGSKSADPNKMRPSFRSEKRPEKPAVSVKIDKSEAKLRKSLPTKSNKETNNDTALKLGSPSMRACTPAKVVKSEGHGTPSSEKITPVKGKESKVKRGSGTEKQLLREKIRNMLLAAHWTIDYRPRRNRDYLDAVYINPSGTAFWSIIKAYEAFQKEEKNAVKPVGEFTPLPDEILSKLTRQTQKKREREMKKKRRDEGSSRSSKKARVKEFADDMNSDQQEEKLRAYKKPYRKSHKSRLNESDPGSDGDSSDNLEEETPRQDKITKQSGSTILQGRKSRKIGRTLVVRSSDKGLNSENDGFVLYTGKRTLLSWLIDSGTVEMNEKVQYMNRKKTRAMLEGWVTRDGIRCGCCSKILTVSKFELHAGSKLRLPFPNIFLQSGQSLMQCQIDAWNKQEESDRKDFHTVDIDGNDPNDDTCGLCGDGGDLICCDGCPATFHQSCLNIQMLPKGDWQCPNCACKFCGIAGGRSAEASGGAENALLICRLCEKKYHDSCREGMGDLRADCSDAGISFCGRECEELYRHLLKLLGLKHELESGFSWSLLCRSDPSSDNLPLEFPQKVECNSKLAIALSIMDECFLPIVDRRSGISIIHNVLYNCGSNFSRLNYSGFYTAILERGDEIIAAASIRIHGVQLAEMPFIGTRHIYRRQGMCRRLLSAIESALSSFKVEKLIIPAIAEHMHTWTDVFGFTPIEESHKQEMRSMNMLVFPGTDMLQKPIREHEIPKGKTTLPSGEDCLKMETGKLASTKSELDSTNLNETNGKIESTESGSQATTAVPSDDSSLDTTSELVSQHPSKVPNRSSSPIIIKVEEPCRDLTELSPSNTTPAILASGDPRLDSPIKVDIQVPVVENKSNPSLELDLNTYDDTEEQEENDISEKVAVGTSGSPLVKENVQLDSKGSESKPDLQCISASDASPVLAETSESHLDKQNVQLDSAGSESKPDFQCISVGDASPVVPETSEAHPVKQNVQLDSMGSESKPDLQCISVGDASPVEPETSESPVAKEDVQLNIPGSKSKPVKEDVQLDIKGSESKPGLQSTSVSDASPVAPETSGSPVVKEDVQLDMLGSESKPDLQSISVSDANPVVPETPESHLVKENVQSESTGSESNPDLQCISVRDASPVPETFQSPLVKEDVQLDILGSESKPELQSISISDASPVVPETSESCPANENVQLDKAGLESKPELQCISASDETAVASVTPESTLVKGNVQSDSNHSESKPDLHCLSVSHSTPVVTETSESTLVKESHQFDSMGSDSKPEVQCISVNIASPVAHETLVSLPVKENAQLDSTDTESKPDLQFISVSDETGVAVVTPEPIPVEENVQFDSNGSESKTDLQFISVSDTSTVALETPEPPFKENDQLDNKGSEADPNSQPITVSNSSPVCLENPEPPKELDLQPISVSESSLVTLKTIEPTKDLDLQPISVNKSSSVILKPPRDTNRQPISVSNSSTVTLEPRETLKLKIDSPVKECIVKGDEVN